MKHLPLFPLLLLPLILFFSCRQPGSPDPDDTLPGREVILLNPDSTPKVVYYYPVDAQGNPTGKHTREIHYLPGKKKYVEGTLQDEKRDGEWKSYFEDGSTVRSIAHFKEGQLDGSYQLFHENGKIWIDGHYAHGLCDGEWIYYDAGGKVTQQFVTDAQSAGCQDCPKCLSLKMK